MFFFFLFCVTFRKTDYQKIYHHDKKNLICVNYSFLWSIPSIPLSKFKHLRFRYLKEQYQNRYFRMHVVRRWKSFTSIKNGRSKLLIVSKIPRETSCVKSTLFRVANLMANWQFRCHEICAFPIQSYGSIFNICIFDFILSKLPVELTRVGNTNI